MENREIQMHRKKKTEIGRQQGNRQIKKERKRSVKKCSNLENRKS